MVERADPRWLSGAMRRRLEGKRQQAKPVNKEPIKLARLIRNHADSRLDNVPYLIKTREGDGKQIDVVNPEYTEVNRRNFQSDSLKRLAAKVQREGPKALTRVRKDDGNTSHEPVQLGSVRGDEIVGTLVEAIGEKDRKFLLNDSGLQGEKTRIAYPTAVDNVYVIETSFEEETGYPKIAEVVVATKVSIVAQKRELPESEVADPAIDLLDPDKSGEDEANVRRGIADFAFEEGRSAEAELREAARKELKGLAVSLRRRAKRSYLVASNSNEGSRLSENVGDALVNAADELQDKIDMMIEHSDPDSEKLEFGILASVKGEIETDALCSALHDISKPMIPLDISSTPDITISELLPTQNDKIFIWKQISRGITTATLVLASPTAIAAKKYDPAGVRS